MAEGVPPSKAYRVNWAFICGGHAAMLSLKFLRLAEEVVEGPKLDST